MNERFALALNDAIEWIKSNYVVRGIIVSGSIIRGNANKNSDFDIYVIHDGQFKQRVQKIFNGVPCEIFICNLEQVYKYFEIESETNRPVAADMIATGTLYIGGEVRQIIQLIEDAKKYVARPFLLSAEKTILSKYSIAILVEDATDIISTDSATAIYILDQCMAKTIEFIFASNNQPLPRMKERIKILLEIDKRLGKEIEAYFLCNDASGKLEIVKSISLRLTGHTGFFEWTSIPA